MLLDACINAAPICISTFSSLDNYIDVAIYLKTLKYTFLHIWDTVIFQLWIIRKNIISKNSNQIVSNLNTKQTPFSRKTNKINKYSKDTITYLWKTENILSQWIVTPFWKNIISKAWEVSWVRLIVIIDLGSDQLALNLPTGTELGNRRNVIIRLLTK